MTGAALLVFFLAVAALARSTLTIVRLDREVRLLRAELDAQRATVAAAAALYGEARMREAARAVAIREGRE